MMQCRDSNECNISALKQKEENKMKKLVLGMFFLVMMFVIPATTMAQIDISIGIALPPPIVFSAPPDVIALPDTTDVYAVPDADADLFFWNGAWWRLWEGRWYRSNYYDRGWVYYDSVPSFYFNVDPGWRGYYRSHYWHGHRWDYERIHYRQLHDNWQNWHRDRYWERRGTWGVQGYKPRPQHELKEQRNQWQQQYRQRPEVQRHEQQIRERRSHPQEQRRQFEQQQHRESRPPESRERHEGGDGRHER
jgi:hypothetical protein